MNGPARAHLSTPGFEHLHRIWESSLGLEAVRLSPGEYYIGSAGEIISTVLGSCVGACIRDPIVGIGGMNHFMLPDTAGEPNWGPKLTAATRYGSYAMEQLINGLLNRGARRDRLEAKLFGGAHVLVGASDVGARNIEFATNYLAAEGVAIAARDLGGEHGRRVLYFTQTGRARVRLLGNESRREVATSEQDYRSRITEEPVGGDVELFE